MAKHTHVAQKVEDNVLESSLKQAEAEKLPIEDMPLETLRMCRYPIKQCPVELHPKQRVKFGNNDGSMNPVPVFVSNHLIHYDEKLQPGRVYDIPECIVHYLSEKGYPIWGWVTLKDGSRETREMEKKPRFSLTTVYQEA
jgi:hypothetical protein